MEKKLKNKILDALQTNRVISVINSQEFYFQKARDVLSDFLQLTVSEESKTFLIANKKEYNELKHYFETSEELLEFGRLIFSLISYCDSNANRKIELNQYQDKRVLALAFVRMNNWVEQLISYKFENQLSDGSIKNAIEYLLNPSDNFTMLSENHRSQISENLFKAPYNKETFKDIFLNFFSEFSISVTNTENYTYVLSCIAYHIATEWKESIIGLVSPDGTGWQNEAIEETKDGKHIALWNHKKPNGTNKTLKLLRQCIEENEFFRIYYTSNHNALYVAEIVDFVTSQSELSKAQWDKKYIGFAWDCKTFTGYKNNNDEKSAKWVYIARKIYKIEPIQSSNFVYHNGFGYPSVGCQAPIISLKSNTEIKNQRQMNSNLKVLNYKKQVILQGPPGTGKTREAKLIAKSILNLENDSELQKSEQYKLIQFHPSFTYEDFVRGIVAQSKGDKIEYKNVNKTLGEFADRAYKNKIDSEKDVSLLSKEMWINEQFEKFVDFINDEIEEKEEIKLTKSVFIINTDEDAFRYKGKKGWSENGNRMLFNDIKTAYLDENAVRQDIKKNKNLSGLAHHHASYYIRVLDMFREFLKTENLIFTPNEKIENELKNYVLIIDEINRANLSSVLGELIYALEYRGEAVESMYAVDDDTKFILPPNLYIIGTMNTSDRSIGHIDYAIRRRFAFIDVLPKVLEIENFQVETFKSISSLFIKNFDAYLLDNNVVLEKSEYLSEEFNPKDVWLGHSYFISTDEEFEIRKKYEIKPILEEYVKDGILKKTAEAIINGL